MAAEPEPARSASAPVWKPPTPVVGMRIMDCNFPDQPWVVAQYDGERSYIYIRREHDGRLWHHTEESWSYAWEREYIVHAS